MMMISHNELFTEPRRSLGPKVVAGISALVITLCTCRLCIMRHRTPHSNQPRQLYRPSLFSGTEEATEGTGMLTMPLLQGSKTIIGGTVRNTFHRETGRIVVEVELKRRKDGGVEKQLIVLNPSQLDPEQEVAIHWN